MLDQLIEELCYLSPLCFFIITAVMSELKEFADLILSIASIAAIIVGGWWTYMLFVRKRQIFPRANTNHQVTHKPITDEKLLLHLSITISNVGDVLIELIEGDVRIYQVIPPPSDVLDFINSGGKPVPSGDTEADWDVVDEKEHKCKIDIEPGESHIIPYDFFINSDVKTIKVYSYFMNVRRHDRLIGWRLITIHDL